jgi:hypothetical protein
MKYSVEIIGELTAEEAATYARNEAEIAKISREREENSARMVQNAAVMLENAAKLLKVTASMMEPTPRSAVIMEIEKVLAAKAKGASVAPKSGRSSLGVSHPYGTRSKTLKEGQGKEQKPYEHG